MAARVAGVPRPQSRMAADSSFSSRLRPADSMAVNSVASVRRRGGRVCLSLVLGVEYRHGLARFESRWQVLVHGIAHRRRWLDCFDPLLEWWLSVADIELFPTQPIDTRAP